MQEETVARDPVADKLVTVARGLVVIAFGLLPVLFIPSPWVSVPFTKILVAFSALLFSAIFFVFSVLRRGTIRTRVEWPALILWGAFGVSILSALFSGNFFNSFWGSEVGVNSAIFTGILALTVTLCHHLLTEKKSIVRLYLLLAASSFTLGIYHFLRVLFGPAFLSFGGIFGQATSSPFTEWNSLAIFFGLVIILSLMALEQLSLKLPGRALFSTVIGLSLAMLVVISFTGVFAVLGLVSLVTLLYSLTKGRLGRSAVVVSQSATPTTSILVNVAILLVSIIFIVGGSTLGQAVSNMTHVSYIEVRPSISATIRIAQQVYAQHALLGSGPNLFLDSWRLYHDPAINSTIFWNTNFQSGYGYVPTIFVTNGVAGGLMWLAFFGSLLYLGFRTFWRTLHTDTTWYFIAVSSYVASVYLWGMSIVYVPGAVLLLTAALCTGIFLAARQTLQPEKVREFNLLENQQGAFMTVGVTVLVIVASVGSLYYFGRHYVAAYQFVSNYSRLQNGIDAQKSLEGISSAFDTTQDDAMARQMALYGQGELMKLMQQQNTGGADIQSVFENTLASAVNIGRKATELNGSNPDNWDALGRVYATVVPLTIENAYQLSHDAFEKARALDPSNPQRLVMLAELELLQKKTADARAYITQALALKPNYTDAMYILTQIEIADGNVAAAIEATSNTAKLDSGNPVRYFQLGVLEFSAKRYADAVRDLKRAVELSADYSNARYFLAFSYDALGQKDLAAQELTQVLALNPDNVEVKELIARLSRGEQLAPTGVTPTEERSLPEGSENTSTNEPVTDKKIPDSTVISPVNRGSGSTQ